MKASQAYSINIVILCGVLLAMIVGTRFHQVNMNRKYWTMLRAEFVNTNALMNLAQETGLVGLAENHVEQVPKWIANINSTMRSGVLAIAGGVFINLFLLLRTRRISEPVS